MKHIAKFAPIITISWYIRKNTYWARKNTFWARKVTGSFEKRAPEITIDTKQLSYGAKLWAGRGN